MTIATKTPTIIYPHMSEWNALPKGELTCPNCQYTGEGVTYHMEHLGGHGDVWVLGCEDIRACFGRAGVKA
jgi:hypothetical protein